MTNRHPTDTHLPLCVDLDGTLVVTDTLVELLVQLLKERPWLLPALPFWLTRGRAHFKQEIAKRASLTAATLPYHPAVLAYVSAEHRTGRKLVLATASPWSVAQAVADHVGLFSQIVATKGLSNASGASKARALTALFGERGFEYLGNSRTDLAVWRHAKTASVVSADTCFIERVKREAPVARTFTPPAASVRSWLRLVRHYQWVKNILVFVPLVASHRVADLALARDSLIAFVAFGAAASSIYILNDAFDVSADRLHPRKRHRPLAAGTIPLTWALAVLPLLLGASLLLAQLLPPAFTAWLAAYLLLTCAYSWYIKRHVVIDVILLALLYTIRIFAGAAAIAVPVSTWLTAFALFFFLSLALVKRFAELKRLASEAKIHATGRGYHVGDLPWLGQLGTASAYLSALVLALYISSSEVLALYETPLLLWTLVPLLIYWLSRLWLFAHRGMNEEDPLVFAMRDRVSYAVLLIALVSIVAAS